MWQRSIWKLHSLAQLGRATRSPDRIGPSQRGDISSAHNAPLPFSRKFRIFLQHAWKYRLLSPLENDSPTPCSRDTLSDAWLFWCYTWRMTTIDAHFDGKAIVPDEPVSLPVGTKLKVSFEPAETSSAKHVIRRPGSARGQVKMAEDFDKTPPEFEDYL